MKEKLIALWIVKERDDTRSKSDECASESDGETIESEELTGVKKFNFFYTQTHI
jgi:hypothetical protein